MGQGGPHAGDAGERPPHARTHAARCAVVSSAAPEAASAPGAVRGWRVLSPRRTAFCRAELPRHRYFGYSKTGGPPHT